MLHKPVFIPCPSKQTYSAWSHGARHKELGFIRDFGGYFDKRQNNTHLRPIFPAQIKWLYFNNYIINNYLYKINADILHYSVRVCAPDYLKGAVDRLDFSTAEEVEKSLDEVSFM